MSIAANLAGGRLTKARALCLIACVLVLAGSIALGLAVMKRKANYGTTAGSGLVAKDTHPNTRNPPERVTLPSNDNEEGITRKYKKVEFKGISFTYPLELAHEITAGIKPAAPLLGATDKPEGVVPEHFSFTFGGPYASERASYFEPEISIYPIPKYREALALSDEYVQSFNEEVDALQKILARRQFSKGKDIPFMPFAMDASQAFHAQVEYVDFRGGKGIFFLTQFNIEPSLVNNEGLLFTFQGLTDDGLYYVSARFPVNAPFLPSTFEDDTHGSYTLPTYFYDGHKEANERSYKLYLEKVVRELEELPRDKFEPDLALPVELIRTLIVKPD